MSRGGSASVIDRAADRIERAAGETALAMAVSQLSPRAIPDWPRSILPLGAKFQ